MPALSDPKAVSGGILSKYLRNSQLANPAMKRSRISRSHAVRPISPKALTANVSKAMANMDGSSPADLVVVYSRPVCPAIHNGPIVHPPALFSMYDETSELAGLHSKLQLGE